MFKTWAGRVWKGNVVFLQEGGMERKSREVWMDEEPGGCETKTVRPGLLDRLSRCSIAVSCRTGFCVQLGRQSKL